MEFYTKSDLIYTDYNWENYSKDHSKVSGNFDSTPFEKNVGNEILFFINKMAEIHNLRAKVTGEKIETLLKEYLPPNINNQEKVFTWIKKNWNNY